MTFLRCYFNICFLLGGVGCYFTGAWAYFKNRQSPVNKYFFLLTLFSGFWSIGHFVMGVTTNYKLAWTSCQILYGSAVLIPSFYVCFIFSLIDEINKRKREILLSFSISLFFLLLIPNKLFIRDVIPKFTFSYYDDLGPLGMLFVLFYAFAPTYSLYRVFLALEKCSRLKSLQLKYVILGSIFGFLGGGSTFLLAFNSPFPPYLLALFVLYPFIALYAIIKYHFMDIRVAVTRAGIFAVVYTLVLGIPFGVIFWTKAWLQGFGYYGVLIPTAIMAVLASVGPFVYTTIRRRAENRLRREEFLAHQALNRLAQDMMRFTNLGILLKLIVHHIVKIMKVYSASVYLRDEGNRHYRLRATWSVNNTSPQQSEFLEDSSLLKDILLRRVPIVSEELRFSQTSKVSSHLKRVQSELHKARAAVVVPAFKGDNLFGLLMLGVRRDNRLFTQDDLNLLLLLANQSALAIENAQLFGREKTLLAEKSRRDALADMAPGVSHQFNNRLMAISVTAEADLALLEQKPFEDFTEEELRALFEKSKQASKRIMQEALKGKDIADAIMKKGKAKITYTETDLAPIIQSAIELLNLSRTKSSLEGTPEPEIILDVEKDLPKLTLSESLIQDIFYNLIDNARDAIVMKEKAIKENKITPDEIPYRGKITISACKKDDKVIVSVEDNGIGIKKEETERIFVPYFTTKATARKGTGMGLWAVRGFIEDHKAKISVESEYTKGATFKIEFPIDAKIKG